MSDDKFELHTDVLEWAKQSGERKIKEQEQDIQVMIDHFDFLKQIPQNESNELYEARWDSYRAKAEIFQAKQKILEMQRQLEQLEGVIREGEKTLRKYKRLVQAESNLTGRGRPEISEEKVRITKYFVTEWVKSLMESLNVTNCQKLESILSSHTSKLELNKVTGKAELITIASKATERNWRRWLKGEAIPSSSTFEILMGTKIDFGKYKGFLLQDIPTTPSSDNLQILLGRI